ncbi:hypothetical protein [Pseudoalteromonas mariniglutinosa]|uniref:hypothetical protein n=1 Tax=Pseudoalteromonas mariniglutinosa TaxID=206042 RepID=UPI00384CA63F
MKTFIALATSIVLLSACTTTFTTQSPAEKLSGYTYIPVDPFSVKTNLGGSCSPSNETASVEGVDVGKIEFSTILESLPDNAVRMSVEQFSASGAVTYGPAGIGAKGESYRVTVDYINADTTNVQLWISKRAENYSDKKIEYVPLLLPNNGEYTYGTEIYEVTREKPTQNVEMYAEYNLPVYVGIGLRVTANIDVTGTTANISGLGAIGAEAESNHLKGSLTVQTLGVNGRAIAAALPIQSELNRTTAQNAIVAIGSIKALLYEQDTIVVPRVVGIYLPFPGGKPLVNAIISELSKDRVVWHRPCVEKSADEPT